MMLPNFFPSASPSTSSQQTPPPSRHFPGLFESLFSFLQRVNYFNLFGDLNDTVPRGGLYRGFLLFTKTELEFANYQHLKKMNNHSSSDEAYNSSSSTSPQKQQYNVYGQPIDPTNQMPLNPNQLPSPGQTKPLPTDRVVSSIPKGGTNNETWHYPSPQMFYNALKRKGKGDDVDEDIVEPIVSIHNSLNEHTWSQILDWEKLHPECAEPRLLRFMGRPDDLTPRAWLRSKLGYPLPFDRHDWIVDRCGREVRYVIDYYHHEDKSSGDELPRSKDDWSAVKSIEVYARPALDSLPAISDRARHAVLAPRRAPVVIQRPAAPPPKPKTPLPPIEPVDIDSMTKEQLSGHSKNIQTKCAGIFQQLKTCEQEGECQKASVALFHCMATFVCPPQALAYRSDFTNTTKLDDMVDCVGRFESKAAELLGRNNKSD